jgi:uncharacterized protein
MRRAASIFVTLLALCLPWGSAKSQTPGGVVLWGIEKVFPELPKLFLEAGAGVMLHEVIKSWLEWYRGPSDPKKQYLLGYAFENGYNENGEYVARNQKKAIEWYHKSAEQDYPPAEYALGRLYYTDDPERAVPWFRKAASHGFAYGQAALGFCYKIGRGVARDEAEAETWLRVGAEQGELDAMGWLADLYNEQMRYEDRNKWLRIAAERGDAWAEGNLGFAYASGTGLAKPDQETAVYWFRRAAQKNDPGGEYGLAQEYWHGLGGLEQDKVKAAGFFAASEQHGYKDAGKDLDELCQSSLASIPGKRLPQLQPAELGLACLGHVRY